MLAHPIFCCFVYCVSFICSCNEYIKNKKFENAKIKNQTLVSPTMKSGPTTRLKVLFGYNSNYTFKFVSDVAPTNLLSVTLTLSSSVMWH
jgi:hypothetical protein